LASFINDSIFWWYSFAAYKNLSAFINLSKFYWSFCPIPCNYFASSILILWPNFSKSILSICLLHLFSISYSISWTFLNNLLIIPRSSYSYYDILESSTRHMVSYRHYYSLLILSERLKIRSVIWTLSWF
jgi:hypothetical protein